MTAPLWRPRNDCGPDCLLFDGERAGVLRRAARLTGLAAVILAAAVVLPFAPRSAPCWARAILRIVGVRVRISGRLPRRRALLVANHVSWLDTVVLLAVVPCRLLAKTEVRGWPVVGRLAAAAGTVFIDRSRPRTLPATVAVVAAALRRRGGGGVPGGNHRLRRDGRAVPSGAVPGGRRRTGAGRAGDDRVRDDSTGVRG
jgi:hypothetical protein